MLTDFRNDLAAPRSGRQRIGNAMWLLRIADKARASAAGTLGEYIYLCPMDRGMLQHWGLDAQRFEAALTLYRDDRALSAWFASVVSDEAVARANAWLVENWTENLERQDREERGGLVGTTGAICANCGVAYPVDAPAPDFCPICADERVASPATQAWTSMHELRSAHRNEMRTIEPGLLANVCTTPAFAIGQRAIIVETSAGCILWDCLSLIDRATIEYIDARGGLRAIAVSHPHFYGAMSEWSATFGDVPVYVHEDDREWVVDAPHALRLWSGETLEVADGVTLVRCGGHFEGGQVMHVARAADGRGALLTGDVIMVAEHGNAVSFMRSYPTYVPLTAPQVGHLRDAVAPFAYDVLYGAWSNRVVPSNGSAIVARTAQRYLDILATGCRQEVAV
jgi:hypothetical protein